MSSAALRNCRWTCALVLAASLLAVGGVTYWCYARSRSVVVDSDRLTILVVSGDTAGWIVPCGCTSNQSGGLLRRGTFVHSISREKMTTVYVADAGGAASG